MVADKLSHRIGHRIGKMFRRALQKRLELLNAVVGLKRENVVRNVRIRIGNSEYVQLRADPGIERPGGIIHREIGARTCGVGTPEVEIISLVPGQRGAAAFVTSHLVLSKMSRNIPRASQHLRERDGRSRNVLILFGAQ